MLDGIYTVRKNKVAPESFLLFSQQWLGILIQNFTDLFAGKWNAILLKNGKVIDFLMSSPTDFPMLKMFKLEMLPNFYHDITVTFW